MAPKDRYRENIAEMQERKREAKEKANVKTVTVRYEGGDYDGQSVEVTDADDEYAVTIPHRAGQMGKVTGERYVKARKPDGTMAMVYQHTFSREEWADLMRFAR
jgi:hypothetical protein